MKNLRRIQFYVFVLLALTFVMISMSYISYRHYLVEYSDSYVENFRLQNLDLIESNSTLQLTQKFELTKMSNITSCLQAKNSNEVFYTYGRCNCHFFNAFNYCVKLTPAGNNKIEILFEMKLPTNLKISFFIFLITNIILSAVSISLLLIYEKSKEDNSLKIFEITKQVAHDIRSPLSALNIITSTMLDIPEEKRLLVRNSVQRINDIANDLLQKGKFAPDKSTSKITNTLPDKKPISIFLTSTVIDNIVSEKRIQFREKINLNINIDLKNSFGLFVNANPNELSRLISNLINNSVEALPNQSGNIDVSVFSNTDGKVCIQVKDNGSGIPKHVLEKLGQAGVTHGKDNTQSGSGLGIYHAIKTIQEFDGQIKFLSVSADDLNNYNLSKTTGTTITIELPKAKTPAWFAESIQLHSNQEFVTVDDDISTHQIWKGRLESLKSKEHNIKTSSFTSANEFRVYYNKTLKGQISKKSNSNERIIFLIDYEFLNQNDTGLKIITELNIQSNSVLVTSRFDEPNIRNECEAQRIKILPKQLVGQIPIAIKSSKTIEYVLEKEQPIKNEYSQKTENQIRYDLCLLDDDKLLVQSVWSMIAKEKGLNIKLFSTPDEFLSVVDSIDRRTPIYIDVSLGNGVSGIEFSEQVHNMGFLNINLATGYPAELLNVPIFIRQVTGKDFPESY